MGCGVSGNARKGARLVVRKNRGEGARGMHCSRKVDTERKSGRAALLRGGGLAGDQWRRRGPARGGEEENARGEKESGRGACGMGSRNVTGAGWGLIVGQGGGWVWFACVRVVCGVRWGVLLCVSAARAVGWGVESRVWLDVWLGLGLGFAGCVGPGCRGGRWPGLRARSPPPDKTFYYLFYF